jgi:hypothetical protein
MKWGDVIESGSKGIVQGKKDWRECFRSVVWDRALGVLICSRSCLPSSGTFLLNLYTIVLCDGLFLYTSYRYLDTCNFCMPSFHLEPSAKYWYQISIIIRSYCIDRSSKRKAQYGDVITSQILRYMVVCVSFQAKEE